jgi:predicted phosphoribosyltransferase
MAVGTGGLDVSRGAGKEAAMFFQDREDAGSRLGELLRMFDLEGAVVLGIPRGGVLVAAKVAEALGGALGVVVARKLRAPDNPELAIGAVTSDGSSYVDPRTLRVLGIDARYLEAERNLQAAEAQRREEVWGGHRRPPVSGRKVIIVDDGIATGATAVAAVRAMRAAGASEVVLAAPVASAERADMLRGEADRVVCLIEDPELFAVGQYYADFRPIEDDEVKAALEAHAAPASGVVEHSVPVRRATGT